MTQTLDRVAEVSATTGTGPFQLGGAIAAHRTFGAALGSDADVWYSAIDQATGAWEVGLGRFVFANNTLQRTIVLSSSGGGAKVSFAAGQKIVFATLPANASLIAQAARPGDSPFVARAAGGQTAALAQFVNAAGVTAARIAPDGTVIVDKSGEQLRFNMRNEPGIGVLTTETLGGPPPQGARIRLGGEGAGDGVLQISNRDLRYVTIRPAIGAIELEQLLPDWGSLSNPAIAWNSNRNTGFYLLGQGVVGFGSQTQEAARLDVPGTGTGQSTTVITREKGDARYATVSSRRYKEAIAAIPPEEVEASKAVHPFAFTYGGELPEGDPRRGQRKVGFIAEDLAQHVPRAVIPKDDLIEDAVYEPGPDGAPRLVTPERVTPQGHIPDRADPIPLLAYLWARVERLEAKIAQMKGDPNGLAS